MNDLLRARLQEITDTGRNWPLRIDALRSEFPHTIQEVHPTAPGRYNCFAFALGLHQSQNYLNVAKQSRNPNVFANPAFISHLIFERILLPTDCTALGQKVIIYFRERVPKHAGVLNKQRVTSKWGDGQFFEHGIFEIPINYGSESECYSFDPKSQIESVFLQYAEKQGVRL